MSVMPYETVGGYLYAFWSQNNDLTLTDMQMAFSERNFQILNIYIHTIESYAIRVLQKASTRQKKHVHDIVRHPHNYPRSLAQ